MTIFPFNSIVSVDAYLTVRHGFSRIKNNKTTEVHRGKESPQINTDYHG